MKAYLLTLGLVVSFSVFAQQKTSILVLSNQEGKLLVDGAEQLWLKSSEPAKLSLEDGDHIIQLKTSAETFTRTISCSDGKQKVINFDESSNAKVSSPHPATDALTVSDIQVDLPGSISGSHQIHKVYRFDEGDEISIDFEILNRNGTVNLILSSYPDNGMIFSKEKVSTITDERIRIPKRGIYYFTFSTNHIVNRSAHFVVKRKAATEAGQTFSTTVQVKYDTAYQEVLNQQVRVYSIGAIGHINRTITRINLPPQTTYWVYWIGVGQESIEKMKQFATQLSGVAAKVPGGALCAFGLQLIPTLPMFNSTATVNYRFADNNNSEIFSNGNPTYQYYNFKEGTNVTTDYAIEKTNIKELNLCLWNNSSFSGHDVNIRVGAFIVKPTFIQEQ